MKLEDCIGKPVLCTDGRVRKVVSVDADTLRVQYPMGDERWSSEFSLHRSHFEEAVTKGTIIE